jgi:DDE superfamily endonuclease
LPALSLDGILHLDILDCPYTAVAFNAFIDGLLNNMNPFPLSNSVIVLDNASIHKSVELQQMIEAQYFVFLFRSSF